MAITQRTRFIANPAQRRKRNAPRRMSAKQAAIFGRTPAIRAAAKRRIRGKRSNPKGHRRRTRRANPGEIIGFTLANPARRKAGMAKPKRRRRSSTRRVNRRRNPARRSNVRHHRRRSNRAVMNSAPRRHRRRAARRSNPGYRRHRRRNPSGMGSITGIVTNAVFVLVGALGSKLGAQLVLGSNNTGWVGYAGNAAIGVGLWFLTEHVMKNKEASSGVIAGTVVEIILRIINDMTPFGSYVSGLGMGDYQMQSFVTPQVLVDPYNSAAIQIPPGWAPTTVVAPSTGGGTGLTPAAASGMGSMYGDQYNAYSTYGY